MNFEQLLEWNRQGIIPGPKESFENFIARATTCAALPLQEESREAANLTAQLFDSKPLWVPIRFSSERLLPWQGGCAWIAKDLTQTLSPIEIQLKPTFQKGSAYCGLYTLQELLSHELAHAGRLAFEEPAYEERFAYETSSSAFRRHFGPLISDRWNQVAFLAAILLSLIPYGFLSPVLLLLFLLLHEGIQKNRYDRCLTNLESCCHQSARAVRYRLTDSEIILFSKMNGGEIFDYALKSAETELRWKVLVKAYFIQFETSREHTWTLSPSSLSEEQEAASGPSPGIPFPSPSSVSAEVPPSLKELYNGRFSSTQKN